MQTQQLLTVVRAEEGRDAVREMAESGRNFFLILPADPDAIRRFCEELQMQSDCLSGSFTRSDLLRMGQYVDATAFDEMLKAWEAKERVVFVDQLDFPLNRPPRARQYIVYSSVWGILSQHDELPAAKHALEEAVDWEDRSRLAQPAIYRWDRSGWKMI